MKRTVIVTGGTKGLGREIALAFGRAGYRVIALYATDQIAADSLQAAFTAAGILGAVWQHDVTTENAAIWNQPEIQEADSLTLIHNACAPFQPVPMHQLQWKDFQSGLDVAVKGGWFCSQALIRLMVKRGGGTIVNILTSAVEGMPPKGFGAYAVAKHALRGLTLSLAVEFGPRGVRVFSASPGFMQTPLTERWFVRLREAIQSGGRNSIPTDAANRIVELVADKATAGQGEDYRI
jgi:NAD(P)-dependent dehydrogenase (short-subunit alcohol dehydrogenase family)